MDVMKGCGAGADDGDVVLPQGRERLADGVEVGRGLGSEDGDLDDGDGGGGMDEEEGDEDAVVPTCCIGRENC